MSAEIETGDPIGRYVGDLLATLDHDPTEAKPFRVLVWEWRYPHWTQRDEDSDPAWYEARGVIDNPVRHRKDFKRLDKALDYLFALRARAEYLIAAKKVRASAESRREEIA